MAPSVLLRNGESSAREQNNPTIDHSLPPQYSAPDSDSESQNHVAKEFIPDATSNTQGELGDVGQLSDSPGEAGVLVDQQDEQPEDHLTTLEAFAKNMSDATTRILETRTEFKRVVVVVSYWENDRKQPHLKENAKKLAKLFREDYKFEVLDYAMPMNTANWMFIYTVGQEIEKVSKDSQSLFILYYGGHATAPPGSSERLWMADNENPTPNIVWSSAIRLLFNDTTCRKLFILDCCYAGDMIDRTVNWCGSCELLAACPPSIQASALETSSFTKAVRKELRKNIYDIWELHSVLCSTDKKVEHDLKTDAWYRDYTGRSYPSVVIRKLGKALGDSDPQLQTASEKLQRLKALSDARILIKVTFKGTATDFLQQSQEIVKDWSRWFRFSPHSISDVLLTAVREARLESLFQSNSCTAIWSMPVWLWDSMTATGSYQYLGVIRSENYVTLKVPDLVPASIQAKTSTVTVDTIHVPMASLALTSAPIDDELQPTEGTRSISPDLDKVDMAVPKPPRNDSPIFDLLGTGKEKPRRWSISGMLKSEEPIFTTVPVAPRLFDHEQSLQDKENEKKRIEESEKQEQEEKRRKDEENEKTKLRGDKTKAEMAREEVEEENRRLNARIEGLEVKLEDDRQNMYTLVKERQENVERLLALERVAREKEGQVDHLETMIKALEEKKDNEIKGLKHLVKALEEVKDNEIESLKHLVKVTERKSEVEQKEIKHSKMVVKELEMEVKAKQNEIEQLVEELKRLHRYEADEKLVIETGLEAAAKLRQIEHLEEEAKSKRKQIEHLKKDLESLLQSYIGKEDREIKRVFEAKVEETQKQIDRLEEEVKILQRKRAEMNISYEQRMRFDSTRSTGTNDSAFSESGFFSEDSSVRHGPS